MTQSPEKVQPWFKKKTQQPITTFNKLVNQSQKRMKDLGPTKDDSKKASHQFP
ncbi:unnamed protein product [Paramecium pentaurelia]|uniref:Uncharacterized protein n=1 Tax=Paramecium pentaurelia TaxID=43138 RepID=A0A8S1SY89_9CILI|nr:unnamed protein product [Paramecium pentaurelia]